MSQGRHVGKLVLDLGGGLGGGTVLVTGGTGGVGSLLARHLVTGRGVRSLVLLSRRGPAADGVRELTRDLEASGAAVRVVAGDVADRTAVAEALADLPPGYPLTAVVHAAGELADGTVGSLTTAGLDRALRAKVGGALCLADLTREKTLSAFILFSALAGTLGTGGQAAYAAANSFLDGLAAQRRAAGLAGTSLGWGWWEQSSGMTAGLDRADAARIRRMGVAPMPAPEALALFDLACARGNPVLIPARMDLPALRNGAGGEIPAVLGDLVGGARPPRNQPAAIEDGRLPDRLAALPEGEALTAVLDCVRDQIAVVLGHPSGAAVDVEQAFKQLGFDSLGSVELSNRLAAVTGLRLPSTLIFSYPTPRQLSEHLYREMAPDRSAGPAGDEDIREVLRTIPIDRLRSAGLLEPLLSCAEPSRPDPAPAETEDLESLDLAALVDLALDERNN
jgi:polyketide synthase 12